MSMNVSPQATFLHLLTPVFQISGGHFNAVMAKINL